MSESATKTDIKRVEKKIDGAVEDLSQIISDFASSVDRRFNIVEARLGYLEARFDKLLNTVYGLRTFYLM